MLVGLLTIRNADETIYAFEGMEVDLYAAPGPLWLGGDIWIGSPLLRTRIDDLRHLIFRDVPAKMVQEILGQSKISMTMDIYSHVLPDMQQEAMGKMNDLLERDMLDDTENSESEGSEQLLP